MINNSINPEFNKKLSMKKMYFIAPIFASVLFLSFSQTQALEVEVLDGYINFYQDDVLGKNSNDNTIAERVPNQITPSMGSMLKVQPVNDSLEVKVQPKINPQQKLLKPAESTKTQRLQIQAPSELKDRARADDDEKDNEEQDSKDENEDQDPNEYLEKVREKRREKTEEMIQIRAQVKNQEKNMAIESRGVNARIKNGAQFSLDTETNEITVTTPSGNTHILNHLPDQALERMKTAGLLTDDSLDGQALDLETSDDGQLKFKLKRAVNKKLFGLFPRKVNQEITLDDQTGEVQDVAAEASSLFETVLNKLTF